MIKEVLLDVAKSMAEKKKQQKRAEDEKAKQLVIATLGFGQAHAHSIQPPCCSPLPAGRPRH